jgi:DNA-binding Lrp family transcriptional regulator
MQLGHFGGHEAIEWHAVRVFGPRVFAGNLGRLQGDLYPTQKNLSCSRNIIAHAPGGDITTAILQESAMPATRLDDIDRMILAELQADGRMTNVELAKRVGISAPPCLRRVRTLEESGYIRGYHADVDARELGFEVQVYAMVGLQSQAEVDLNAFETLCRDWPLVRECHMLNGEVDFILKCVAPDLSTFQRFLTEELTAADNVISVKTSLVIRGAKDEPGVPFDVLEERLSRTA